MPSLKSPSPQIQSSARTILLVEDEPILRAVLSQGLQADGYTVLEAGFGKDALGICQQHVGPIHLLIADVVLPKTKDREMKGSPSGVPELDGIQVAQRLVATRSGFPSPLSRVPSPCIHLPPAYRVCPWVGFEPCPEEGHAFTTDATESRGRAKGKRTGETISL